MVLSLGGIYGSKVVIIVEENVDVGVRETNGRDKGVNRWMVREVFRAEVRGVKAREVGGDEFF